MLARGINLKTLLEHHIRLKMDKYRRYKVTSFHFHRLKEESIHLFMLEILISKFSLRFNDLKPFYFKHTFFLIIYLDAPSGDLGLKLLNHTECWDLSTFLRLLNPWAHYPLIFSKLLLERHLWTYMAAISTCAILLSVLARNLDRESR